MIANLNGYTPENIDFVLTEAVKEKFPNVIFEGAEDIEEITKIVNEKFTAVYPENEIAERLLDTFEINEIREEYCLLQENEVPVLLEKLENAVETAKRIKKNAEDAVTALNTQIMKLASRVKEGTTDYNLSSKNTIRIALCKYYLFYSWVNGKMQLVKAMPIPEWDNRSLWAQETKNREAMKELFGIEFPDMENPPVHEAETYEEDDDDENEDF